MPTSSFEHLITKAKLVTFVGTGGVGKTSLSTAVAIEAARKGRRVAAITVDPSRRLSDVMGMDPSARGPHDFENENITGGLSVFHVDTEEAFREFVSSHMGSKLYEKMASNKIYQQISKNLRETHNFAALYRMVGVLESKDYDLVVLDTPPCHQVVEFFEAPGRLQKFFSPREARTQQGWLNWVQRKGVQAIEGFFSTIVGREFVSEMDAFFQVVGQLRESISTVSASFTRALAEESSELFVVFSGAKDKVAETKYLSQQIASQQYRVSGYLLNRAFVPGLDHGQELSQSTDSEEEKIYAFLKGQQQASRRLLGDLQKVAPESAEHFVMLPEINCPLREQNDLMEFSQTVRDQWVDI